MRALLSSLRELVLGETWTIPLGVGAAVVAGLLLRAVLPEELWENAGGFALALLVVATLAVSLRADR